MLLDEIARLKGLLQKDSSFESIVKQKPLSKKELNGIRKRCEEATPGPWVSLWVGRDISMGCSYIMRAFNRTQSDGYSYQKRKDLYISGGTVTVENQDFIAHARQDIPLLLYEVTRLRNLLEKKR